jgi:hypothetical protein
MATAQHERSVISELADFFAANPTPEQILAHHPSSAAQEYLRDLLERNREGQLTHDEREELTELRGVEMLMQLLKAKIRLHQKKK